MPDDKDELAGAIPAEAPGEGEEADKSGTGEGEPEAPESEQPEKTEEEQDEEGEPSKTKSKASLTEPGGKSYEALRIKLQEQGREKNEFASKVKALETEVSSLSAYKEWYDQWYPAMDKVWKEMPEARQLMQQISEGKTFSKKEAEQIIMSKLSEYEGKTKAEKETDSWLNSHPDVKGKLAQDMYDYLDKHDLNPTPDILDMVHAYYTRGKTKDAGKAEEIARQKNLSSIKVGGGGTGSPASKKSEVDDLFMTPDSHFEPTYKFK